MEIERLKEHIINNDLIPNILESLGCHHIKNKGDYITCANPDGDNVNAVCVYKNDNLTTVNYTRDICKNGSTGDIISLVEFYKQLSFPYAIKWICECVGLEYYHNFDENIPESLRMTRLMLELQGTAENTDDDVPLKPISEHILDYFKPYCNHMFFEDGVSYETQREFEIGYDEYSNRITIPIRDDIGNLVGVKSRYFERKVPDDQQKFLYIEKCARSQILYGLYRAIPYIKNKGRVFVTEAEKGVQQLVSHGYDESVASGGKKMSRSQIDKLTRLCVPIIFLFDKDVTQSELEELSDRFVDGTTIYAVIDDKNILDEKESPTDNIEKFNKLLNECIYKLK